MWADGLFDLGITGRDWVVETSSEVVSLGELQYSKNTSRPIRMVLAVPDDSPWNAAEDLPQGVKISSEYPALTKRFFDDLGIEADIALSYGATEAKAPDIVDAVVEITETGRALRAAGLKIIHTVLTSYTELVANPASYADPERRHAMEQIHTLLSGVLEARGQGAGEDERDGRELGQGDRPAAVHEGAHRERAVRGSRLRGGDRRPQGRHQYLDPRPARRRGQRHHRTAAGQDRPLSLAHRGAPLIGTVANFDDAAGWGVVAVESGTAYPFPLHGDRRRNPHHRGRHHGDLLAGARPPRRMGGGWGYSSLAPSASSTTREICTNAMRI